MAISPKKLKSYMAAQKAESKFGAHHDEEEALEHEGETPEEMAEHEAAETPAEEEAEHEGEGYDAEDAEDEEEEEVGGYEDFVSELYGNADALEQAAEKLGVKLGHEDAPVPQVLAKIKQALQSMPAEIRDGVKQHLKGMAFDEVIALADELADEGQIEDAERVGAWLYWAGKVA